MHIAIAFHPVKFYSQQQGNWPYLLDLAFKCGVLSKEAPNTKSLVWPGQGIEPKTSRIPGKHSTIGPLGAVYLSSDNTYSQSCVPAGIGKKPCKTNVTTWACCFCDIH